MGKVTATKSLLTIMVVLLAILIMKGSDDDDESSLFVQGGHIEMHVRNELSMMLIVHCQSGDDDLGARVVPVNSEYSWGFWPKISTLFWCDLAVQDKRAHFDAFSNKGYCTFDWLVNDNGIYVNDPNCDPVHYPWPN